MTQVIGAKGQVVISKAIRDRLGIERGWYAIQQIVGDHVEMYFVPPPHQRSLRGSLKDRIRRAPAADEDWASIRERAWADAGGERGDKP